MIARCIAVGVVGFVFAASLTRNIAVPSGVPNNSDLLIHLAMQAAVGFLILYAWPKGKWLTVLVILVFVVGLEIGQVVVPGRSFSLSDLGANASGACLGATLAFRIKTRQS